MGRERVKSILVATDLGEGSELIVAAAASLSAQTGAELHMLHSLDLPWVPSDHVMRRTGFIGQIEDANRRLHEQGLHVSGGSAAPASELVIIYVAHRAILDRAEEVSADLIVLGRHRGSARRPLFLGTTADRVVRSAKAPCLIIGDAVHFPVPRVGVATDFSAPARQALLLAVAWAPDLAKSAVGELGEDEGTRVVHIAHPMILAGDPELAEAIQRQMSDELELGRVARKPGARTGVRPEVVWDDQPGEALVNWVSREQIGLLVLGTHGHGSLSRALIGSLAVSMARLAPCPVLLVPPPSERGNSPG